MGMYTELVLSCKVKNEPVAIAVIKTMIGTDELLHHQLPQHSFFQATHWQFMLKCSSYHLLPRSMKLFEYDEIGGYWCFICRCDFKNYDGEVELFIEMSQS